MDQGLLTKANLRKGSAEKMGKLIHISSMADRDILVNWQKFKYFTDGYCICCKNEPWRRGCLPDGLRRRLERAPTRAKNRASAFFSSLASVMRQMTGSKRPFSTCGLEKEGLCCCLIRRILHTLSVWFVTFTHIRAQCIIVYRGWQCKLHTHTAGHEKCVRGVHDEKKSSTNCP